MSDCDHRLILEESGNELRWVCTNCNEEFSSDGVFGETKTRVVEVGTLNKMFNLVMQARSEIGNGFQSADKKLSEVQNKLDELIQNKIGE